MERPVIQLARHLVVAALIASGVVVSACGGTSSAGHASSAWDRIGSGSIEGSGDAQLAMREVAVGGPGFVAVGTDGSGGDIEAAVWTSADGVTWTRVPHDEAVFGGDGDQWMFSITVGGPGLVAGGSERTSDFDAAVWTSTDGLVWSRVSHDEAVFGGNGGHSRCHCRRSGFGGRGIGRRGLFFGPCSVDDTDGVDWSRVPPDHAAFDGNGNEAMTGVASGGPGLVAVGVSGDFSTPSAAVWTSVDGDTWSRVPHDEAVFSGGDGYRMSSIQAAGFGFVAVGSLILTVIDWEAAVWTSPDGVAWARVAQNDGAFGGDGLQVMRDVADGPDGLIAVGSSDIDDETDAAVWTSDDGSRWFRIDRDAAAFGGSGFQNMWGLATSNTGAVAVGTDSGPAAWTTQGE